MRAALKLELESFWPFPQASTWFDSGFDPDELFLKINFPGPWELAVRLANDIKTDLPGLLKMHSSLRGFDNLRASSLVCRDGPRLKSKAPDPSLSDSNSFLVAWPYEQWKGSTVTVELPSALPLRFSENFLHSAEIGNLFAAGKCAGLPDREMSAARVIGSCWTMGEQVAKMIARGVV